MYKRKKKKISRPFEDQADIEALLHKTDSSLFMYASNSKKRPNNIVAGRLFDSHVLDMFEFGVEKFVSMQNFPGAKPTLGSKPCIVFSGEAFDADVEYKRLKNFFIDFLRGPKVEHLRLQGVEHVYHLTAADGKIYFRSYRILLKKSGSRVPRVELEVVGPSVDLVVRRTKLASDDLYKRAKRQPDAARPKKRKNISRDAFGTQLGRVHMEKMDLSKLQTRKMKGLKRKVFAGEKSEETVDQSVPTSPGHQKSSSRRRKRREAENDMEVDEDQEPSSKMLKVQS
jgi:ribosome production factor 2